MAFGKTAGCLILAGAGWLQAAQFTVTHAHKFKGCTGVMTVTDEGISFRGEKKDAWQWKYQDIEQLKLSPGGIQVVTYQDSRLRLGADREYNFTGTIPAEELYQLWKRRLDQRFVAELGKAPGQPSWSLPVKHLRRIAGSDGTLAFGADGIAYTTGAKGESRTWRYEDIVNISSSGPFQLTLTTFERAWSHYGDRKGFNFQLKQPITEARYNELWLQIEKKNGRIQ
jgi:hypothetical protein